MDRCYLIPWGRREILLALLVGALGVSALIALSHFHSLLWAAGLMVWLPFIALLVLFFRNPRRQVPAGPGDMVAPADGTVTDVAEVDEPELVQGRAVRVGIFLSIFSVHVNRAPVAGQVERVLHRDGAHHDARKPECATENESNCIVLVGDEPSYPAGTRFVVKQVSGAIARRIICPLSPGDHVVRGGLVGMIKYGSRTELYFPVALGARVLVQPGDRVTGGETVLARLF